MCKKYGVKESAAPGGLTAEVAVAEINALYGRHN